MKKEKNNPDTPPAPEPERSRRQARPTFKTIHMDMFVNDQGALLCETILQTVPNPGKLGTNDILLCTEAKNGTFTTFMQAGVWDAAKRGNKWREGPKLKAINQTPVKGKLTDNKAVDQHLADVRAYIQDSKIIVLPNPDL